MTKDGTSLVIVSKKIDHDLEDCLACVEKQIIKPQEVIVVASEMDASQFIERWPDFIPIQYTADRSTARNIGWRKATYNRICFWESDSIFNPEWIQEVEKVFQEGADAVIDRRKMYKPKGYFEKCWDHQFDLRYARYSPFSAWAFKRTVLEDLEGFDQQLEYAEDTDLGLRMISKGYKIILAERAIQHHKGEPRGLRSVVKRRYIFGREKGRGFYIKHPDLLPRRHVTATVLTPVLLSAATIYGGILIGVLILAGIFIGSTIRLQIFENRDGLVKLRYIPGMALLRLCGGLSNQIGLIIGSLNKKRYKIIQNS